MYNVLCVMTSCGLVGRCQRYTDTYCFHPQGEVRVKATDSLCMFIAAHHNTQYCAKQNVIHRLCMSVRYRELQGLGYDMSLKFLQYIGILYKVNRTANIPQNVNWTANVNLTFLTVHFQSTNRPTVYCQYAIYTPYVQSRNVRTAICS